MCNKLHQSALVSFLLVLALLCFRPCLVLIDLGICRHPGVPQLLDIDLAVSQAANAPSRAAWLASGPAAANSLGNTAEKFKPALFGEVSESFVTSQSSAFELTLPTRAPPLGLPV